MQVEPQTIKDIAEKVGSWRFRCRNTKTLNDYFILHSPEQGFVVVANLDNGQYIHVNAEMKNYALLSSINEIKHLNNIKHESAVKVAYENYGNYGNGNQT